ncbi:MAG: hypothetical protein U5R06_21700 [candidate division KSB1 bacterium]|nr:hypothetical protein [candidate division KSB1 bacterium]
MMNRDQTHIHDQTYGFLFYECSIPNRLQTHSGWTVEQSDLDAFFRQNLTANGFTANEIHDFIDYWCPRLVDYPVYEIYPQTRKDIDPLVKLHISEPPQTLLRLYYFLENGPIHSLLIQPQILSLTISFFFAY